MKCQSCHQTVTRKGQYCPNCGTPIIPRSSQNQPALQSKPIKLVSALALIAAGALVGFLIFKFAGSDSGSENNADFPLALQSPAVLEVAKEFACPCGNCNDALDTCTCDHPKGAFEVKGFIAQQLAAGHKKPHIVEMVQQKYGGRKNQTSLKLDFQLPGQTSKPN